MKMEAKLIAILTRCIVLFGLVQWCCVCCDLPSIKLYSVITHPFIYCTFTKSLWNSCQMLVNWQGMKCKPEVITERSGIGAGV